MRRISAWMAMIGALSCTTTAKPEDVPGRYELRGSTIKDVLELSADGGFIHTAFGPNGARLLNERGKWEWEERPPEPNKTIVDVFGLTTVVPGMEAAGLWPATIEKNCGTIRLIVNRDIQLYYEKIAP